jgi:hypothetical protein
MKPKVMIVLLSKDWAGISRLPQALNRAACEVATFCSDDSYLAKTIYSQVRYKLQTPKTAFSGLAAAVDDYKPDILIPGCELTVDWFHNILRIKKSVVPQIEYLKKMIGLSLGSPDHFDVTLSKNLMHSFALKLGLTVPPQHTVNSLNHAKQAANSLGYPVVIKGEFGFAGNNVRICRSESFIEKNYQEISAMNSDKRIDIQKFIDGIPSMCVGVANGELLESFFALKICTYPHPTSPCSVALLSETTEATQAKSTLSALVKNLNFKGFCSCDFIFERATKALYLLEFNPRPVPLSSLGHIFGYDLCNAFSKSLGNQSNVSVATTRLNNHISLFPNEYLRDKNSPYLISGYHDVPWNDPILLQALLPPSFNFFNNSQLKISELSNNA